MDFKILSLLSSLRFSTYQATLTSQSCPQRWDSSLGCGTSTHEHALCRSPWSPWLIARNTRRWMWLDIWRYRKIIPVFRIVWMNESLLLSMILGLVQCDMSIIIYWICSCTEYTWGCKTICPHEADDRRRARHWQDIPPRTAQARRYWIIQEEASGGQFFFLVYRVRMYHIKSDFMNMKWLFILAWFYGSIFYFAALGKANGKQKHQYPHLQRDKHVNRWCWYWWLDIWEESPRS